MGDLSAHFSRSEFDCHDGARAHPDPSLVMHLEALRALRGGARLRIVSGFRTPAYNRKVGGAPLSQHLFNRAADLESGYATVDLAQEAGFTGVGWKPGALGVRWAVHVDVRIAGEVVFRDG